MAQSLQETVREPQGPKSAIRQSLMSPAGKRTVWVVVEAEDDYAVYSKFMDPNTTVVKTSEDREGRKGYANVEIIVKEIREEVPVAHIIGIRDADYSKYENGFVVGENVFLTDCRDLEMMMLASESVRQALDEWMSGYEAVLGKCVPICRHFGYLRIINDVHDLGCTFHDKLRTRMFWDYTHQSLKTDWKEKSTTQFVELTGGQCDRGALEVFVEEMLLEEGSFYDICRGHDLLPLLSLTMIDTKKYSVDSIMAKMVATYSLVDFKQTQLYENIRTWQEVEGINALAA